METISIKQPWASLIVEPDTDNPGFGIKPIENRTWKCPQKYIGKRVLVHASKSWTKSNAEICLCIPHVKEALERLAVIHKYDDESIGYKGYSFSGLTCGEIIGSVEIVDCVVNHESIWAEKFSATTACPECSCEEYLNENLVGKGYRNCKMCGQEWWTDVNYGKTIYNWVLANPIKFPEPIPAKGKLSFWDYPNILAEPEEKGGMLYCHCQLPVNEKAQVANYGRGDFRCCYCGARWYK